MNRAKINSEAIVRGGDKRCRMEDSLLTCWHQRLRSRGLLCKNPGLTQLFFCSVACSNRGFYIQMQRSWSSATVVWVLMDTKVQGQQNVSLPGMSPHRRRRPSNQIKARPAFHEWHLCVQSYVQLIWVHSRQHQSGRCK